MNHSTKTKPGKLKLNRLAHATTKLAVVVLLCATFSPPANALPIPPVPDGTVVREWNENAIHAITVDNGYANPLQGTHVLAMVHVAIHDAVNGALHQYERYEYAGHDPYANPTAAAAAAAHFVLTKSFPAQQSDLNARLSESLHHLQIPKSRERRGMELGRKAADAIWKRRLDDGSDKFGDYTPGTAPGRWQFTPPYEDFIFVPAWQFVTPWALAQADQFRVPEAPPALDSAQYALDYNEVKSIGQLNSATRTPEQTTYGRFWYEFSDIGWNRITRVVSASQDLDLAQSARLFALVNIAMADSYIAGWDSKLHYDFWRPITAIRAGDTDGNPATEADATWEPLMVTPPIQDYPSTHSVLGDAAAEVLGSILGDDTAFTTTSGSATQPNVEVRSFNSFTQAADENGDSRVIVGIHFRSAVNAGQQMGREIGRYVYQNRLRRHDRGQ